MQSDPQYFLYLFLTGLRLKHRIINIDLTHLMLFLDIVVVIDILL